MARISILSVSPVLYDLFMRTFLSLSLFVHPAMAAYPAKNKAADIPETLNHPFSLATGLSERQYLHIWQFPLMTFLP